MKAKNLGMLVLAVYLIVIGVAGIVNSFSPGIFGPILALAAGVLILIGK